MSEILTGLNGRQYVITEHIKSGGEGGVYGTDAPELVAKLYDTSKINIDARMEELERKIRYMVEHRIPTKVPDGTVIVTWPQDILYKDGKFVGYIMPRVSGAKPIYMLKRGGDSANKVIPKYDWKKAVSVAANLAYIISFLHSKNVVIGDMNSDNLLVYPNGFVVVIDTDSFDIRDEASGAHYKCTVGTEEFLPPELQGHDLGRSNVSFSKHTDEFALAVHIFQLLMNNMHPFNARVITGYNQSLPENNQNYNISVGNCPFIRKIEGCTVPLGAPELRELLPDYLFQDFHRTFSYSLDQSDPDYMAKLAMIEKVRTPAGEWYRHLKQLLNDPGLVPCQKNPAHYYLASREHCELCEAEERLAREINLKPGLKPASPGSDPASRSDSSDPKPAPPKPKRRKNWIAVVAAALAIMLTAGFGGQQVMRYLNYKNALAYYNAGDYERATDIFLELGDYKDSTNYWVRSMVSYIEDHYDNSDLTTYKYVLMLITLEVAPEEMMTIYNDLYSWRIEGAFVNTDPKDHSVSMSKVSNEDMKYAHFRIAGGTPGETLSVYTAQRLGDFSEDPSDYEIEEDRKDEYTVEDSEWIDSSGWYFTDPSNAGNGLWTMTVFRSEDDVVLGYATVEYGDPSEPDVDISEEPAETADENDSSELLASIAAEIAAMDIDLEGPGDSQEPESGTADDDYVLPGSDSRYLTADDLKYLSEEELRLARNEIYARHGRRFQSADLDEYFSAKSWYQGTIPPDQFNEAVLNSYEKANLVKIKQMEAIESGNYSKEYILPDSSSRYLSENELRSLSKDQLRLARNEIYARHGRLFDSGDLQDYFNGTSWYYGYISPDQFNENVLNQYEKKNLVTIRSVEDSK